MNVQPSYTKLASPLGEGERIEVRGFTESSESNNPHPALSLEKGEAIEHADSMRSRQDFDYS
jgi:hypothetical protein